MNITIKKWGNSQGVIIPKLVLSSLGLSVDDNLSLDFDDEKIILSKPSCNDDYSDLILEDLIEKGFEGEKLLSEFKKARRNLPNAINRLKDELLDEYNRGEMINYEELFDE